MALIDFLKLGDLVATKKARILFGVVGLGMLYGLIKGLWTGEFNMHGDPYTSDDHPIGFYAYAAFFAFNGLAGLTLAVFAKDPNSDR